MKRNSSLESQLVNKFSEFYASQNFMTAFTKNLSLVTVLSQINPVDCPPSYLLRIHFNTVFPSTSRPCKCSLSLRFPHQTLYVPLLPPCNKIILTDISLKRINVMNKIKAHATPEFMKVKGLLLEINKLLYHKIRITKHVLLAACSDKSIFKNYIFRSCSNKL